jgi:CRP-like cAMP-binding protein
MDKETEGTIKECLRGFFFTDDAGMYRIIIVFLNKSVLRCMSLSRAANKMDLFLRAMSREEIAPGDAVITEGEPGKKLYVIESGKLEVKIQGEFIRELQRGYA